MRKIFLYLLLYLLQTGLVFATHNRAGEITFRHISGMTYEFTVTTYTYQLSQANRSELRVDWGDNTSSIAPLIQRTTLPNYYFHNIYIATHTFPGPGVYRILMQDPNRNAGVQNIPNSVNVVFSIETTFIINSYTGDNNSPILLNPPKDRAALGHIFIHNPSAFDPDGDSLSYKLAICTEQNGNPIPNYSYPRASDTLYVDPTTGDLVWNSPIDTGKFNIAMNIEEWRKGIKIDNIVRDMQIEVFRTNNNPPVNPESRSFCIEAGKVLEFSLLTTDPDNDPVNQQLTGGPFILTTDTATFTIDSSGRGFSSSTFRWQTHCDDVRRLPYQLVLKSEDINPDINLVDIDNFYVTVIAPAPTGLTTTSTSTSITVKWNPSPCGKVIGYNIYRRSDRYDFVPDSCENGVPAYTGYVKIASVSGISDTSYIDGAGTEGLSQGLEYCYIITAIFADGAESYASIPVCASLIPGFPALTNVSVIAHDSLEGKIFLAWVKPGNFDTIAAPGPYVIRIFRSESATAERVLIDSLQVNTLSDTTYIDSLLNTYRYPYYYSVKIINNTPGNRFEIGADFTEVASSLYLDIVPDDNRLTINFRRKVPWVNTEYTVYRQNPATLGFDSVGTSIKDFYVDSNLANMTQYCYKVISKGWRPFDSLIYINENISHIGCGIPQDITPPCPPDLTVVPLCDSSTNVLTWTNPNNTCANDVVKYRIYYSMTLNGDADSIITVYDPMDTVFRHVLTENLQLAGCYYVTAIDSFENESVPSEKVCVDECYLYELPNVFTPNGDELNKYFMANNRNNAVKQINLKVFNRWGELVYETTDPNFQWDGKIMKTKKLVSPGIYYYLCDVYEPRLMGIYIRNLSGFVYVFTDEARPSVIKPE